jgi:hypothetical protein
MLTYPTPWALLVGPQRGGRRRIPVFEPFFVICVTCLGDLSGEVLTKTEARQSEDGPVLRSFSEEKSVANY